MFNTDEPTVAVRMIGYASYGPTDDNGCPALVLRNGEVHDVPQTEADWLIGADLAERV